MAHCRGDDRSTARLNGWTYDMAAKTAGSVLGGW